MPTESEVAPDHAFEAHVFWEQHKSKINLYAGLVIAALVIFATYQYTSEQRAAAASTALAQAAKPEDYRQVIEKYPRTVAAGDAYLLLAKQLRDDQKYDDAIAALRTFTQQFEKHPLASTGWLSLGQTLEAAGKTDEAADTYQQVTTKFPDSYSAPIAALAQANLLRAKGKIDDAKRAYENVVAQYPESYFAQQALRDMKLLRK